MDNKVLITKLKRYFWVTQIIMVIAFTVMVYMSTFDVMKAGISFLIIFLITVLLIIITSWMIESQLKKDSGFGSVKNAIAKEIEKNSPIPGVVLDHNGKVVWYNKTLTEMIGKKEYLGRKIEEVIPGVDFEKHVMDFPANNESVIKSNDKYLKMKIDILKSKLEDSKSHYTIYFFDVTDAIVAANKLEEEKTNFGYVYIDNYEDIINSIEEEKRAIMLGLIERRLHAFAKELGGSIKRLERDKFLMIVTRSKLDEIINTKFKILEDMRKINIGNELPITLSIGVGTYGETIDQMMESARDAAEIAITRGGNQAVIKKGDNDYEFFGAKSKQEIESLSTSKAKARIKAYELKELFQTVENVLVMGHKNADLDALGSALCVFRLAKEMGKNAHIVLESINSTLEILYDKIINSDEYDKGLFISRKEALDFDSGDTALVIVDVNVPTYTEVPELIEAMDKVAIIDHHIRGTSFVEKAKVVYLDPFASSACECMVQIAQYMTEKIKFTSIELDSMLAGILVDTKQFKFKTGVKTFEAAAYLKKMGADNSRVQYLFQNDLETYIKKAESISKAEIYNKKIIITECPKTEDNYSVVVAQIADDMLNISGIGASFVLYQTDEDIIAISARSSGNINVQIIMEELGGGGHYSSAGAQVEGTNMKDIRKKLKNIIDKYFEDDSEKEE